MMLKENSIVKNIFGFILILGIFVICDKSGGSKYILTVAMSLILLVMGRKNQWSLAVLACVAIPAVTYVIVGGLSSLFSVHFYAETVKTMVFWLVPLLIAFSLYVYFKEHMPDIVIYEFIATCVVYLGPKGLELIGAARYESIYAFTFGIFFVYFFYEKRWVLCLLSLGLMNFADKRIAVLASAAAIFVMVIQWFFRYSKKLLYLIWGVMVAAICGYVYLTYSGILQYFSKGLGVNTNGRMVMYEKIANWFGTKPLICGQGLGVIEKLLVHWNVSAFQNLHNDLLKFFIELGLVGLLIFLLSYILVFYLSEKYIGAKETGFLLSMTIYTMLLLFTDNVSIYIVYLIPLYSVYFAILSKSDIRSGTKTNKT